MCYDNFYNSRLPFHHFLNTSVIKNVHGNSTYLKFIAINSQLENLEVLDVGRLKKAMPTELLTISYLCTVDMW